MEKAAENKQGKHTGTCKYVLVLAVLVVSRTNGSVHGVQPNVGVRVVV
jgi:hypothetical protein